MFYTIQRLYRKTKNKEVPVRAFKKGWITAEERDKILSENL